MRKSEELEILIAAQVDLAVSRAEAIDPEKIRAKVEAILTIVISLLQSLKGNLTVIGIAFQAGKVVTAIRDIVALFKKA